MRYTLSAMVLGLSSLMMVQTAGAAEGNKEMSHMHDMSNMKEMSGMAMSTDNQATDQKLINGSGVIKQIDLKNNKITIAHGAIAEINWPAMAMTFGIGQQVQNINALKQGESVDFSFVQQGNNYTVEKVTAK